MYKDYLTYVVLALSQKTATFLNINNGISRCCQCLNNLCDEQKNNWTDKTSKNLELCFNWIELFAKLPSHHQILNWQSRPSHDSELISPYCNSQMTLGTNSLLLLKKEKEMCQSLIQHSTLPFELKLKIDPQQLNNDPSIRKQHWPWCVSSIY
jgi:hypothetical protein